MPEKCFVISGRSTGMGAFTTAYGEVIRQSKTGKHWDEKVYLGEGETVKLIDITNSGKHHCRLLKNESGELVDVRLPKLSCGMCPICDSKK